MAASDVLANYFPSNHVAGRAAGLGDPEFGNDVLARLGELMPGLEVFPSLGQVPPSDVLVVALWRPDVDFLCETQVRSWANGTSLLPITHDGRAVRIGPLAAPAVAPCIGCLVGRLDQHAAYVQSVKIARQASAEPHFGVRGHLPHHASAAAAVARRALASPAIAAHVAPGRAAVYTVELDQLTVHENTLLALPGCAFCGDGARPTPPREISTQLVQVS